MGDEHSERMSATARGTRSRDDSVTDSATFTGVDLTEGVPAVHGRAVHGSCLKFTPQISVANPVMSQIV